MRLVKRIALALVGLGFVAVVPAVAQQPAGGEYPGLETGKMWTFDVPPLEYWARRYNFRPSQEWLDHARLSAARIGGCTASFVSADGLVMTNNHCARGCVTAVSRQGEDLLGNGFYAQTRADERACPNGFVEILQQITDVTNDVNAAVPAATPTNRAADLRNQAIRGIQDRCRGNATDVTCQVVTMYRGGQYKLYRFHRYNDVRLVFAPEVSVAFWGGDPDNFTYPRYDLDVTFMRAYENGQPAHPEQFFRWSRDGSRENDLVFVVGNPGSTGRLNTVAQLEYLRDVQYPAQLDAFAQTIPVYQSLAALSPERAQALRNTLFGIQNSQKATIGYLSGLTDPQTMAHKTAWERDFRNRVNANPELRQRYGAAWDNIARIRQQMRAVGPRLRYHTFNAYGTRLLNYAGSIVRYATEMAKPDSARLTPFRDAMRPRLESMLYGNVPIDTTQEIRLLSAYFTALAHDLPAADPVRRQALGGRSPEDAARAMVTASQILTGDQRRALVQGGASAIAASTDPFIALARVIDPLERAISTQWTAWTNEESRNDELIARALLAVFGNSVAPDATFSLRITDGEVKRYPMNGTFAPAYTTFYGLYDRAYGFGLQDPWALTPRWLAARSRLDLATPFNAVSTNDIIGGNSGSPVVNRSGEVVGLIFDGNIEQLPNRFIYTDEVARSVAVHSRAIPEALRAIFQAGRIADELEGKARNP